MLLRYLMIVVLVLGAVSCGDDEASTSNEQPGAGLCDDDQ